MCLRASRLTCPLMPGVVGVFVNEDKPKWSACMLIVLGLNDVQLHGKESPEYCRSLHYRRLKIIKAFSIDHPKTWKGYDYEKVCDLFPVRY